MHLLLLTLSNLGDVVLTTPVIELLRARYPDARIDIAGDARSLPLLAATPGLVRCFAKDKSRPARGSLHLLAELRRYQYDLVVDLRSPVLGRLCRSPRVLGVPWWQRKAAAPMHSAQTHVQVLRPLFGDVVAPPVRLHLPTEMSEQARLQLAHLPRPLVALAPGANWLPKTWPPTHFARVMRELAPKAGGWLLLGSPADRASLAPLLEAGGATLHDAVGRTGLLEAAALLREADAFLGNDSGLGHMAAAVGVPTLTVFGPGEPARYHPWSPMARWLVSPSGRIEDVVPVAAADVLRGMLGG